MGTNNGGGQQCEEEEDEEDEEGDQWGRGGGCNLTARRDVTAPRWHTFNDWPAFRAPIPVQRLRVSDMKEVGRYPVTEAAAEHIYRSISKKFGRFWKIGLHRWHTNGVLKVWPKEGRTDFVIISIFAVFSFKVLTYWTKTNTCHLLEDLRELTFQDADSVMKNIRPSGVFVGKQFSLGFHFQPYS